MNSQDESLEQFFSACGRALVWVQTFEQEILSSIILHAIAQNKVVSKDEVNTLLERSGRRALKSHLKEIFQRVRFEPDLSPMFFEAVEKRNYFVHQLLWDRYELWVNAESRSVATKEIIELEELFRNAHQFAKGITEMYAKQAGITEDMLAIELERILQKAY